MNSHPINAAQDRILNEREHPARVLAWVFHGSCWIMAALCIYLLSFGPVLRFAARPVTVKVAGPTVRPMMTSGVSYPGWVTTVYLPAFSIVGPDPRPEYGHHDPLNTYRRYLQWWTP